MRTVVSVSMSPEMATRLKSSAAERGQNFSARVCELLESGELHEVLVDRMDEGLFAQTDEDSVEQASGSDADRSDVPDPSPRESVIADAADSAPAEQNQDDTSRRERALRGDLGREEQDKARLPSVDSLDASESDHRTVAERVYACVTAEKISVKEIAERAGVSEVEAGEVLERLIDHDGEPIGLGRVGGEWVCWIQIAHG